MNEDEMAAAAWIFSILWFLAGLGVGFIIWGG